MPAVDEAVASIPPWLQQRGCQAVSGSSGGLCSLPSETADDGTLSLLLQVNRASPAADGLLGEPRDKESVRALLLLAWYIVGQAPEPPRGQEDY